MTTESHETLVQLKIFALEAEIPLWVEGSARAGDLLVIDGLTGKLIQK